MTFSTNVPNAGQSPGVFPAQNNTNFTRLQTIVVADHVFNNTAAANDGFHNQVTLVNRADPVGANPIIYSKLVSGLPVPYFWNGLSGRPLEYGGFPQILAAVNFNGLGSNGLKTRRSQFNVASVTRTGEGQYTIVFGAALADTDYLVFATGHCTTSSGKVCNGSVDGNVAYATAVQVGEVRVLFNGSGSGYADVDMGNIIVVKVQ
jgi:hypothetical protein